MSTHAPLSLVHQVLDKTAEQYGDWPALKVKRNGDWHTFTWREYRHNSRLVARGLMALGLTPGKGLAIIGYNCAEWFFADVGAILAGGVPAGIYTTSSPEQCQYIAHHCEAPVVIVEDKAQLVKFQQVWGDCPHLKHIVIMHGGSDVHDRRVLTWAQLLNKADEVPESALEARLAAQKPNDVCTLIYTSGTTGTPKAVMITHDNVTFTARTTVQSVGISAGDHALSYLPLSHIAEQMLSLHGPMLLHGCVWFAESMELLGDNLREARPHYFLGVPRVWEKIQAKIVAAAQHNGPLKKKLGAWARGMGLKGGYAIQRKQPLPVMYGLADKLVFAAVRKKLGLDRCKLQVTSAAPISKDTLEFFLSLGIPLFEVYGMSECCGPATISTPDRFATGKAGYALPGTEVKIAEDGEVCMRGRHVFAGYYKNPEATAETLDADGWLHSGDVGVIGPDGMLQITDRKKDILITAGGENVAPQLIEGLLKAVPVIAQAVVVGDARKYLAALLTLDAERVELEAKLCGSPARTPAQAAACPKFAEHLQRQIDAVNAKLAQVQTIKRFTVLPAELTPEGGELTPTMKVKRKVVAEKYASEIANLYV
jgi:long-subunit acyl-CoA synthetase (AMP-forming)